MQEGGVAAQGGAFPSLMQGVVAEGDKYRNLIGSKTLNSSPYSHCGFNCRKQIVFINFIFRPMFINRVSVPRVESALSGTSEEYQANGVSFSR